MKENKTKRILAWIALGLMAIFSVTLVVTFASPDLCNGAFGWMALVSGLSGIGLFLVVRFVLKEKTSPDYLPDEKEGEKDDTADETDGSANEPTESEPKD